MIKDINYVGVKELTKLVRILYECRKEDVSFTFSTDGNAYVLIGEDDAICFKVDDREKTHLVDFNTGETENYTDYKQVFNKIKALCVGEYE